MRVWSIVPFAVLVGCGTQPVPGCDTGCDTGGDDLEVALENDGIACVYSQDFGEVYPGGDDTYEEDAPLTIKVVFDECFTGAADVTDDSCTATVDGAIIEVEASALVTVPSGINPSDCNAVVVHCETEAAAAGTYTVEYAGGTTTVDVPSTTEPPCTVDGVP